MATQTWKEYIWQKVYETGPKKNLIYIQNSPTDYFCLKNELYPYVYNDWYYSYYQNLKVIIIRKPNCQIMENPYLNK